MNKHLIDSQLALLSGIDFSELARVLARIAQTAVELGLLRRQMQLVNPLNGFAEDLLRQTEMLSRAIDFGEPFRALPR